MCVLFRVSLSFSVIFVCIFALCLCLCLFVYHIFYLMRIGPLYSCHNFCQFFSCIAQPSHIFLQYLALLSCAIVIISFFPFNFGSTTLLLFLSLTLTLTLPLHCLCISNSYCGLHIINSMNILLPIDCG